MLQPWVASGVNGISMSFTSFFLRSFRKVIDAHVKLRCMVWRADASLDDARIHLSSFEKSGSGLDLLQTRNQNTIMSLC